MVERGLWKPEGPPHILHLISSKIIFSSSRSIRVIERKILLSWLYSIVVCDGSVPGDRSRTASVVSCCLWSHLVKGWAVGCLEKDG